MSVASGTGEHFDIGRVFSTIGGLIGRNFIPFYVLALLFAGLPSLLIFLLQLSMMPEDMRGGIYTTSGMLGFAFLAILATLPTYVLQAALTRASVDDLTGKGVSLGSALQSGVSTLLPLLGLAVVMTLGIAAGLVAFIVPGLILLVCWLVSAPVLVVERTGIFDAMRRSMQLTRNHRWALFGMLVLYLVAYIIIMSIMGATMAVSTGVEGLARPSLTMGIIQALIGSFAWLVTTVGIAAVYFELRRIKDGVGVNELASVFD